MSMTIGASAAYSYAPAARPAQPAAAGGDVVALGVAAKSARAAAPLLATLQQTDTQLGAAAASIGTDLTV